MNRRRAVPTVLSRGVPYLLRDDFSADIAAGSINGTYATDGRNVRTVTDTNSKLSFTGGNASFATGGAGAANPGMWYPSHVRTAGKVLLSGINETSTAGGAIGWGTAQSGGLLNGFRFVGTALSYYNVGATTVVGAVTVGVLYYVAAILRANGGFGLIKGGTEYPEWTLVYMRNDNETQTPLYPAMPVVGATTVYTCPTMRIPQQTVLIAPLVSDNFTAADGALGNTRGRGSEESGGSGLAWTVQLGTGAIASNKAAFSALDGGSGLGVATVPSGKADVLVEAIITRSAGNAGLVLRWTDASNYITAYLDGTNLVVVEVVGGSPNTLATTAVTYGATKRMVAALFGTKIRMYYGDALVGSELTTAVTSGNAHGLYTSDTGATFDNLVIWARGTGGEYSLLSRFLA